MRDVSDQRTGLMTSSLDDVAKSCNFLQRLMSSSLDDVTKYNSIQRTSEFETTEDQRGVTTERKAKCFRSADRSDDVSP